MITPVGDENFIISHMVTVKGDETYVMLFNNSWEQPATASFRISPFSGIESMTYVSPFNGSEYPVTIKDGTITETFRPGEGKLYRLNGKLSYRVLPLDYEHSRLTVDLSAAASLAGVDVSFPLHESDMAVALQICTNKKFTEEKTTVHLFTEIPTNGKLRFEPTVGKYLRLSVGENGDDPAYGWAEIRVRFTDEGEEALAVDTDISIQDPAPVVIPLHATRENVARLLPACLAGTDENGDTISLIPVWEIRNFDASLPGSCQISGVVTLPNNQLRNVHVSVTVTYEVDFSDLNHAISVVEELKEAEYSAESWKAVQDYYEAAVAMKDGTYPQNAVTVAAWQLLDRVRELEPVQWIMASESHSEDAPKEKKSIRVVKGILPAAVATLAGAVAGAVAGIFASKKRK